LVGQSPAPVSAGRTPSGRPTRWIRRRLPLTELKSILQKTSIPSSILSSKDFNTTFNRLQYCLQKASMLLQALEDAANPLLKRLPGG